MMSQWRWAICCLSLCALLPLERLAAQVPAPNFWTRSTQKEPLYFVLSRALKGDSLSSDGPQLRLALVELARGRVPEEPQAAVLLYRYKRENLGTLSEKDYLSLLHISKSYQTLLTQVGLFRFAEDELTIYQLRHLDFAKARPYLLSLARAERRYFAVRGRMRLALLEIFSEQVSSLWLKSVCSEASVRNSSKRFLLQNLELAHHPAPPPSGLARSRTDRGRCAVLMLLQIDQRRSLLSPKAYVQERGLLLVRAHALLSMRHNVAKRSLFAEDELPIKWASRLQALEAEAERVPASPGQDAFEVSSVPDE